MIDSLNLYTDGYACAACYLSEKLSSYCSSKKVNEIDKDQATNRTFEKRFSCTLYEFPY